MDCWKVFIATLLGLFGATNAQNFYVIAPNAFRLNAAETIAVVDEGSTRYPSVKVIVKDYPGKTKIISLTVVPITPGQPQVFTINLDPMDFPPIFFSSPSKMVYLTAETRNVKKEIIVPITYESGYVFIQTDKPIYNPNQNASIRIISLNEEKIISHKDIKLQIKNPNGVIVKERFYKHTSNPPAEIMKTEVYKFPSYPVLGNWSATVCYGYNFQLKSTVNFELREYVLPTFTVELKTPDVILPSTETIKIGVVAQYVYEKKVQGTVIFKVGVKMHDQCTKYVELFEPKELDRGSYELLIKTDVLKNHKDLGWFPSIEGSRLIVEATVIETASGKKENATDSKTGFFKSPFVISFKGCLLDFKPGLNSIFEAHIRYVNGNPAAGISTRIKAKADNTILHIAEDSAVSDENGKVSFEIQPEIHHRLISVTIETTDSRYVGSQAVGTFQQKRTESSINAFISISRSTLQRLKPGDTFSKLIHFKPKGIKNIYYMVINSGKIISMDSLPSGHFEVQALKFQVTHEMVPSFRLVVFAHHGKELLADSMKIDVERVCDPRSEVFIENDFEVKEPGYEGTINLQGTARTWVGLLGVDEAVYALSKKDLLTKSKMFDRFASHDLGCGPGGGLNVESVLSNAGVIIATNNYSPVMTVNRCFTYMQKECCRLGIQPDKDTKKTCEERAKGDRRLFGKPQDCLDAFTKCCLNTTLTVKVPEKENSGGSSGWFVFPVMTSFSFGGSDSTDSEDPAPVSFDGIDLVYTDAKDEDFFEESTSVRSNFRETWIFENIQIRSDNKQEFRAILPHSITTWVIQAVSVSPQHGMCVAEPQKLVSFKKIFLHLNLPYSVVKNEQVEIQATVFNYGNKKLAVTVYMYGVEGLCTGTQPGQRSERKRFYLDGHSAQSVTFKAIPQKTGVFPIKIVVLTSEGNDVIQKELHVVPEGITKEIDISIKLDPSNQQKRKRRAMYSELYSDTIDSYQKLQETTVTLSVPDNHVPGTASCYITAIGDQMGLIVETSMNNPDALLKGPGKCGEQNMVNLAPTLYTIKYLTVSKKLTPEQERKGYEFIRSGYDAQMKYRKNDGSYAAFPHRETSTWLTAFVMKVFCQARDLVNMDENVLKSGLLWLAKHQESNGSYVERKPVYAQYMMGGVQGSTPLTAFVLIALSECKYRELLRLRRSEERAVAYLEANFDYVNKTLPTAIVAYALALSDSRKKYIANNRLLSMATIDTDSNMMYWETENGAQDIETAGYALLTQQLLYSDQEKSVPIANWLNTKQQQSGFFRSTQDTIVALQSLSEYAIHNQAPRLNLTSIISLSNDESTHMLNFEEANALILQDVKVEKIGGNLSIITTGDGVGSLAVKLRYNLLESLENICKFDLTINVTKQDSSPTQSNLSDSSSILTALIDSIPIAKYQDQVRNEKMKLLISVCVRYLGNTDAGMSIVYVELFSGFKPSLGDLKKLQDDPNHFIQMYETTDRGVVFYLEKVPTRKKYCFSFLITRESIVTNLQQSVVKVYDYYNPDEACTKFYKPDNNSSMQQTICEGDPCSCLKKPDLNFLSSPSSLKRSQSYNNTFVTNECPTNRILANTTGSSRIERSDKIKVLVCKNYDYVWKGEVTGEVYSHGVFFNFSFVIDEVIKDGIEKKSELEEETRTIQVHEACPDLLPGVTYLIMGKDGQRYNGNDGVTQYRYLLDKTSVIYVWTTPRAARDRELQRTLNLFEKNLLLNGC